MLSLDTGRTSLVPVAESAQRAFIGGRGLGVSILSEQHPVPDPLDPASPLCMLVGPLNGTMIPLANRLCFVFRSPQTGTIAWAHTGGYVAASLGAAGLSGLVLRGRAPAPVLLEVSATGVVQRDATDLAGLGAIDTTDRLRTRYRDARILAIGPAGEALTPIATVINDKGRASGVRHGLGAVLGSKNVKAIVIRGGRAPGGAVGGAAQAKQLRPLIARLHGALRGSPVLGPKDGSLARHGTAIAVEALGHAEGLPTRNYRYTVMPRHRELGGLRMSETILARRETCTACPVRCRREVRTTGRYQAHGEGPDFAQLTSLGTSCDLADLEAVAYMNLLCFELGLDPIEVGNTLALLAEVTERGLLPRKDGLRWGDADRMVELIRLAGRRDGIGELLAVGAAGAAEQLGVPGLAMASKRMSIQNVDPRVEPAWGLLAATDAYGAAAHIWAFADLIDGLQTTGVRPVVGRDSPADAIAAAVVARQDLNAVIDSLTMCVFSSYAYTVDDYAEALSTVRGDAVTGTELLDTGARIIALERMYNQRLGVTAAADTLPSRFTEEPVPSGKHRGRVCDLPGLLDAYYRRRGWTGGDAASAVAHRSAP
jgi:aldehyde:ferredoxin oxidoreductase